MRPTNISKMPSTSMNVENSQLITVTKTSTDAKLCNSDKRCVYGFFLLVLVLKRGKTSSKYFNFVFHFLTSFELLSKLNIEMKTEIKIFENRFTTVPLNINAIKKDSCTQHLSELPTWQRY